METCMSRERLVTHLGVIPEMIDAYCAQLRFQPPRFAEALQVFAAHARHYKGFSDTLEALCRKAVPKGRIIRTPFTIHLSMQESEYGFLQGGEADVERSLYIINEERAARITSTLGIRFTDERTYYNAEIATMVGGIHGFKGLEEYEREHARGELSTLMKELPHKYRPWVEERLAPLKTV